MLALNRGATANLLGVSVDIVNRMTHAQDLLTDGKGNVTIASIEKFTGYPVNQMPPPEDLWLDSHRLAEKVGVSVSVILRHMAIGTLPSYYHRGKKSALYTHAATWAEREFNVTWAKATPPVEEPAADPTPSADPGTVAAYNHLRAALIAYVTPYLSNAAARSLGAVSSVPTDDEILEAVRNMEAQCNGLRKRMAQARPLLNSIMNDAGRITDIFGNYKPAASDRTAAQS